MLDPTPWQTDFEAAMNDNLNTPVACGVLDALAVAILVANRGGQQIEPAQRVLRQLCRVFGLRLDAAEPEPRVVEGWRRHLEKFE